MRLQTQAQIRRFDEEKAELKAAVEARGAGVEEVRLETEAQMRRFEEEKAELEATVDTRRAAADEVRVQTEAQMRRFDEETAELEATADTRRAAVTKCVSRLRPRYSGLTKRKQNWMRLKLDELHWEKCVATRAQIRRFDEEKAELEAAVEARGAAADEVRLQTQARILRLDEEKAELATAAAARQAEAERQLSEAQRQLNEADKINGAERELLLLQTANLERLTAEAHVALV